MTTTFFLPQQNDNCHQTQSGTSTAFLENKILLKKSAQYWFILGFALPKWKWWQKNWLIASCFDRAGLNYVCHGKISKGRRLHPESNNGYGYTEFPVLLKHVIGAFSAFQLATCINPAFCVLLLLVLDFLVASCDRLSLLHWNGLALYCMTQHNSGGQPGRVGAAD